MTKYKIVTDSYAGFEVRYWHWWLPFWVQPRINTFGSIERAKAYIQELKNGGLYTE